MKSNKNLIAAVVALLMSGAAAADNHSVTVSLMLDPTSSSTATQGASILYRCTKGTAPSFALASGSTSSATGGNLVNGAESIAYTFSSTTGGAGAGMGAGNDKTLALSVSVNQANAANVTPATYTDSIAITLTP
jgi:spore coat protein U-like protein